MRVALLVVACIGIGVLTLRKPVWGVIIPIALAICIPYTAVERLLGGMQIHPATFAVLAIGMIHLVFQRGKFRPLLSQHPYVFITLGLVVAAILLYTAPLNPPAVALTLNVVLAPITFFAYSAGVLLESPSQVRLVRNWLIGLALAQVAVAGISRMLGRPLFFAQDYAKQYWYQDLLGSGRNLGTLDHPLMLALFLAVMIPLLASLRSGWLQALFAMAFGTGVLLTHSRVGLAFALIGVIYLVARRVRTLKQALLIGGGTVLAGIALWLSGLANSVLGRIIQSFGVSDPREDAVGTFFKVWNDYLLFGSQTGNSYGVAAAEGMTTSFESPFFMYTIDYGLPVAIAYFATLLVLTIYAFKTARLPGIGISMGVILIMLQSSSSLGVNTFAGMFVWLLAAIGITAIPQTQEPETPIGPGAVEPMAPVGAQDTVSPTPITPAAADSAPHP